MAKVDKVICPICVFTSRYIDLILTNEGDATIQHYPIFLRAEKVEYQTEYIKNFYL
jgi:hypothetical protein